ncbi:MAG TPA: DUF1802 family protein [Tepidisphaeraceae bacterium]|jgi:hypothetical protein|nr:DUF1802 family protein [Tepidisphaeraceae bacterium]
MLLPDSLSIALKEWASVCSAMESGRQMILLRKGGIYEAAGEFELENSQFLLFPTYLHQSTKMLKAEAHGGVRPVESEPGQIQLSAAGAVTDIVRLRSRAQMDAIEDEHVWTGPLIDMRFHYKPANPLYLLLVRVYRLASPLMVANTPAYAGCKSWVPLDQPVATTGAVSVLDDARYDFHRTTILNAIVQ